MKTMPGIDLSQPRLPPQNLEAEQSVLGAVLLDNQAMAKAMELIVEENFYRTAHRKIYRAIYFIRRKKFCGKQNGKCRNNCVSEIHRIAFANLDVCRNKEQNYAEASFWNLSSANSVSFPLFPRPI